MLFWLILPENSSEGLLRLKNDTKEMALYVEAEAPLTSKEINMIHLATFNLILPIAPSSYFYIWQSL